MQQQGAQALAQGTCLSASRMDEGAEAWWRTTGVGGVSVFVFCMFSVLPSVSDSCVQVAGGRGQSRGWLFLDGQPRATPAPPGSSSTRPTPEHSELLVGPPAAVWPLVAILSLWLGSSAEVHSMKTCPQCPVPSEPSTPLLPCLLPFMILHKVSHTLSTPRVEPGPPNVTKHFLEGSPIPSMCQCNGLFDVRHSTAFFFSTYYFELH